MIGRSASLLDRISSARRAGPADSLASDVAIRENDSWLTRVARPAETEGPVLSCPHCARANPPAALFCHNDGCPLGDAAPDFARQRRFPAPFVFPSGRACGSFDELALACLDDWPAAVELLQDGTLAAFFSHLGRPDLAFAAGQAAALAADPERGLDDLLRQLPAGVLRPARLAVEPERLDLGRLRVGQDAQATLRLVNQGMGLLHGRVTSDVPWLGVGDGEGATTRHFRCLQETTLELRVLGRALRAGRRPQVGRLAVASSGGAAVVEVQVEVPPTVFAAGMLAGAWSPRQLAEKARLAPRESARHFESGAVARWYAENGWTYPVEGEPATGVAAVQQFFDALGLTTAPALRLSETSIALAAPAGEAVQHTLRLFTEEKRPVYARAAGDQPWLVVRGIDLDGSSAEIHLSVPAVEGEVGETHHATLTVTGNGRLRFDVPVTLEVQPGVGGRRTSCQLVPPSPPSQPGAGSAAEPASLPEWIPVRLPEVSPAPTLSPAPPARRRRTRRAILLSLAALLIPGVIVVALARPWTRGRDAGPVAAAPAAEAAAATLPGPADREQSVNGKEDLSSPPSPRPPAGEVLSQALQQPPRPKEIRLPEVRLSPVEVVFCIDTTGSMGGLLDGAKKKIWAICNQIAGGRPTPDLKVGLVAYRDRGDEYVTRVTPLTRDLDELHARLQELRAEGGGDFPESVNQALHEAVTKMAWATDGRTLRIIFLVGDAPPHMDYKDDVKYPETCKVAVSRGILINTVQCGSDFKCRRAWEEIAKLARGEYVAIPQAGGVVAKARPEDGPLAELGRQLLDTALLFGDETTRKRGERMLAEARKLTGAAAADRAAFAAKSKRVSPYDLLEAVEARRVRLEDVPEQELPDALRELKTADDRRAHLEKVRARREELRGGVLELEKRRAAAGAGERGDKDGFDGKVLEVLRKQAKTFGIDY